VSLGSDVGPRCDSSQAARREAARVLSELAQPTGKLLAARLRAGRAHAAMSRSVVGVLGEQPLGQPGCGCYGGDEWVCGWPSCGHRATLEAPFGNLFPFGNEGRPKRLRAGCIGSPAPTT
jgi:hypothetical protein